MGEEQPADMTPAGGRGQAAHPVEETIATLTPFVRPRLRVRRPCAHVARASKFSVIGLLGGPRPATAAASAAAAAHAGPAALWYA